MFSVKGVMMEKRETFRIVGVSDDHAAETVLSILSAVPGATFAELSAIDGMATVDFDEELASLEDFKTAVTSAGYEVE